MEAVRQIVQVKDRMLHLELPPSFEAREVEVIVLPAERQSVRLDHAGPTIRRPSPKLRGTRILVDIMAPAIPEGDWDALK